jgi:hypothetical protein
MLRNMPLPSLFCLLNTRRPTLLVESVSMHGETLPPMLPFIPAPMNYDLPRKVERLLEIGSDPNACDNDANTYSWPVTQGKVA